MHTDLTADPNKVSTIRLGETAMTFRDPITNVETQVLKSEGARLYISKSTNPDNQIMQILIDAPVHVAALPSSIFPNIRVGDESAPDPSSFGYVQTNTSVPLDDVRRSQISFEPSLVVPQLLEPTYDANHISAIDKYLFFHYCLPQIKKLLFCHSTKSDDGMLNIPLNELKQRVVQFNIICTDQGHYVVKRIAVDINRFVEGMTFDQFTRQKAHCNLHPNEICYLQEIPSRPMDSAFHPTDAPMADASHMLSGDDELLFINRRYVCTDPRTRLVHLTGRKLVHSPDPADYLNPMIDRAHLNAAESCYLATDSLAHSVFRTIREDGVPSEREFPY
jgi:hypothetical protein